MSSKTVSPGSSAAWRISGWATLAFACGTMLVFVVLHRFVAHDIQRRTDAWLSREVEVLADVAEHTPKDRLYRTVVGEVAELASREVPHRTRASAAESDPVFFLQMDGGGSPQLWVGAGDGHSIETAIRKQQLAPDTPTDLNVARASVPFRVVCIRLQDGSNIYLGLSERDELRVLRHLLWRFLVLGLTIVLFGFLIVFYVTRRMLGHVREITEAASRIGQSDLSSRVPATPRNDEIGQLARTLNHMLDRIESSMHQLHTITDSLAHDLRSPLTAIRGKLEISLSTGVSLSSGTAAAPAEAIVSAIEELDRLNDFLNTSLDVAEARADALRLHKSRVDLDNLLRTMTELYEPSMADRGLHVHLRSSGPVEVWVDDALLHRMIANLLDNELKHLPSACTVSIALQTRSGDALITVEDDGPGFPAELCSHIFERRAKGRESSGHGLGLAFVEAVARAHGGSVSATNRPQGGACLEIALPLASPGPQETSGSPLSLAAG